MKPLKILGVVLLVLVVSVFFFGWFEIRHGFSARGEPSSIERFLATTARKLALPSSYRRLRNSLPASAENIQTGMEHFADHCATCHGNDGGGDTTFGKGLYPKPPDMRKPETQNKSDGELYYDIENGVALSGMPAFGDGSGTGDVDTWKLVVFIRHLPQLRSEELQKMEQLNPKTQEERQEEKEEEEFLSGANPQSRSGSSHHHH
jgi:mono/diheme cytochrome c family protein